MTKTCSKLNTQNLLIRANSTQVQIIEKKKELKRLFNLLSTDGAIDYRSFNKSFENNDLSFDSNIFIQILKILVCYSMPILTQTQLMEFIYTVKAESNENNLRSIQNDKSKRNEKTKLKNSKAGFKGVRIPKLSFSNFKEPNGQLKSPEPIKADSIPGSDSPKVDNIESEDNYSAQIIAQIFESIDIKHQGKIRYNYFKKLIEDLGVPLSNEEIKLAFYFGDFDKDRKLSLNDFVKVVENNTEAMF